VVPARQLIGRRYFFRCVCKTHYDIQPARCVVCGRVYMQKRKVNDGSLTIRKPDASVPKV